MNTSDSKSSPDKQSKANNSKPSRMLPTPVVRKLGAQAIKGTPRARFRFFGSLVLKASNNRIPEGRSIPSRTSKTSKKHKSITEKKSVKLRPKSENTPRNSQRPPETTKSSLWHRLDVRFPWLKIAATIVIGLVALMDILKFTISDVADPNNKIRVAPMSKHLRASERVLEGKKLVALTFDDGPSAETTPVLLDKLFEKDVPATFFMLGYMVRNNPDIAKRIDKEYHSASSHTMYHQNLIRIPVSAVESDINEARATIEAAIGHSPEYTRPPYGNYNTAVKTVAGTPLILWSVDTLDWQNKNPDSIVSTALSQAHDGAIILMHDIYPTSVEAVPILIDKLRENGYEFVTLQELANARGRHLDNGEVYYRFLP